MDKSDYENYAVPIYKNRDHDSNIQESRSKLVCNNKLIYT